MINTAKAVQSLYPSVTRLIDDGFPNIQAFDANGNEVTLNLNSIQSWVDPDAYIAKRASEYPNITDYIDGVVKGDQAQIDKYIADCLAVKAKYPKGAA
jgi:hypothetical protein